MNINGKQQKKIVFFSCVRFSYTNRTKRTVHAWPHGNIIWPSFAAFPFVCHLFFIYFFLPVVKIICNRRCTKVAWGGGEIGKQWEQRWPIQRARGFHPFVSNVAIPFNPQPVLMYNIIFEIYFHILRAVNGGPVTVVRVRVKSLAVDGRARTRTAKREN